MLSYVPFAITVRPLGMLKNFCILVMFDGFDALVRLVASSANGTTIISESVLAMINPSSTCKSGWEVSGKKIGFPYVSLGNLPSVVS